MVFDVCFGMISIELSKCFLEVKELFRCGVIDKQMHDVTHRKKIVYIIDQK